MTRTKAHRGRGTTLTSKTCELGARVRVTASTGLMAGQTGSIVAGPSTDRPTIRFKSGQELRISMRKLQLIQEASGAPPPPPARPQMVKAEDARIVLTKPDGTKQVLKPMNVDELNPTQDDVEVLPKSLKKKPIIRRDDADWNF